MCGCTAALIWTDWDQTRSSFWSRFWAHLVQQESPQFIRQSPPPNHRVKSFHNLCIRSDSTDGKCDILFQFLRLKKCFRYSGLVYLVICTNCRITSFRVRTDVVVSSHVSPITAQPRTMALMFQLRHQKQVLLIHAWWAQFLLRIDTVDYLQRTGYSLRKRDFVTDVSNSFHVLASDLSSLCSSFHQVCPLNSYWIKKTAVSICITYPLIFAHVLTWWNEEQFTFLRKFIFFNFL